MKSLAEHLGVDDPRVTPEVGAVTAAIPPTESELLDLEGVEFCQGIVNSREYRESIYRRILCDELAAAVECRILDMALGKPPQRLEHTGKDGKPIEVTRVERVIVDTLAGATVSATTH